MPFQMLADYFLFKSILACRGLDLDKTVKLLILFRYSFFEAHCDLFPKFSFSFEFLRLDCLDITFKHTTGLLRCQGFQEKYKRLTKVVKAKPKARGSKIKNLLIFL